jgi:hypothetical protein
MKKVYRFNSFDNLNEAAKKEFKQDIDKIAKELVEKELTKTMLSRYDMIKLIEKDKSIIDILEQNIENENTRENELNKISRDIADDYTHNPLLKELNIKSETYIKKGDKPEGKKVFYWIGDLEPDKEYMLYNEYIKTYKHKMNIPKSENKPTKRTNENMNPHVQKFNDFE